mmetsp:Transcript_4834/g.8608  ORF Transcript_4834/g.8608 Transcript_4834/m.8608 type:complete len:105 (-) Transcript_4834:262-576(-)|eukprot:CAMPEP_0184509450 /NCGR_PEP_ID=MMETSP0198_2-20121128/1291_1 /TAXON_ID=1112570 /ORGANISM="Thraustochytrium sp., Strain LLF1b" /LENGTH=104 /DNA_ID=CAMNT_0026899283 /DNA_START=167 /DNA_END=481 /DNA_ORIENTATION=-
MADRDLKIKTGVLKRAVKEHAMYQEEVTKLTAELERLGPDHDRFRQSGQALDESKAMLLDAVNRVTQAKETLEMFLETEGPTEETELSKEASDLIEQAAKVTSA